MTHALRLTAEARDDIHRLQGFLLDNDPAAAKAAVVAIDKAFSLLAWSPFSCRKATLQENPLLRELVIPFGRAGFVALFEIDSADAVTVLAVRHQREEDYY